MGRIDVGRASVTRLWISGRNQKEKEEEKEGERFKNKKGDGENKGSPLHMMDQEHVAE